MTNIIISLWAFFILAFLGVIIFRIVTKNYQNYLFQNYNEVGIPYITLNVQGQLLNLIVDSGAAVSIITRKALDSLSYKSCLRKIELSATTSESIPADMVTIPININGREIQEDFVVHTVKDLANFEAQHGIVAHGILGNEFFVKTGCKIDYGKHSVILY